MVFGSRGFSEVSPPETVGYPTTMIKRAGPEHPLWRFLAGKIISK